MEQEIEDAKSWLADASKNVHSISLDQIDEENNEIIFSLKAEAATPQFSENEDEEEEELDSWDDSPPENQTFAISLDQPHSFISRCDALAELESESTQFCFGDRTRSIVDILNFVNKYIRLQKSSWGDDFDDGVPSVEEKTEEMLANLSLTRQRSYVTLDPEQIEQMQRTMIERISTRYRMTLSAAGILLRRCKWNEAEFVRLYESNPAELCAKGGVGHQQLDRVFAEPTDPELILTCGICFDETEAKNTFALACEHRFCVECWKNHLKCAIRSGGPSGASCLFLTCPGEKCSLIVGEEVFAHLLERPVFEKYLERLIKSFVDDNDAVTWCPSPRCNNAVAFSRRRKTVECGCGYRFCFECLETAHAPASCQQFVKWRDLDKGDQNLDTKYLLTQTKPCPHCGVRTQKNGGCMYMSCIRCSKAWCWQCGKSDHHVFECNRPTYGEGDAKDSTDLNRYLFYYERFFNHTQSLKFAEEQLSTADRQASAMMELGMSVKDVDFLIKAVKLVIICRQVLRYTYVRAFYTENEYELRLFEYRQRNLEDYTEKLSQLTEGELEALCSKEGRNKVIDWTNALSKYLDGMEHE
eukprot:TRINITY_DN5339_c0_g1_i3.p1 TRINITY_DN5339_c0_g1~~TRINITY_DN5339_c0_g1_i3.p1  ORF type:complete len:585 (-),score=114.62 TRINITY_DN5339_c0_g1_i3:14-1768(-)